MNLTDYFARIGYSGSAEPTRDNLFAVHRAHATGLTYENLDVVLQRPLDQDIDRIYTKIVDQGRGGWCYEMNGLLGWALDAMGFAVTRLCGGVMRAAAGDDAFGNHLVLLIRMGANTTFIADVGLGDGLLEPISLTSGEHGQDWRRCRLELLKPNEWRFHNREGGMPPSFDFTTDATNEPLLAQTCRKLQDDPESMFRQNLICQRMSSTGGNMLLGRVLTSMPTGTRRLLESEQELVHTLTDIFQLTPPPLNDLWSQVCARHTLLFGNKSADEISFGPD